MGFDFSGFVLRAPRTAPSNFTTTDEASDGVDRDFKPLSTDYSIPSPELVEVAADQYRSAVLLRANDGETQYLVWAANTANLSDVGDFVVADGTATFPTGDTPVENTNTIFAGTTGSNRVIIVDDADRSIREITNLDVVRGDSGAVVQLDGHGEWNPVTGAFTITDPATIAALGGGVSSIRGDRATTLRYLLEPPTFWWTKNDLYDTRFVWNGRLQRWVPLRGTPPRDLGTLLKDESYVLSPAPQRVNNGDFLPGNSADPDQYCMVRIGTRPDAASIPVAEPVAASDFGGIKVVTDDEAEEFDFGAEPTLAGVVGQESGQLVWNPAFVDEYAGQTIFYSYQSFVDQVDIEPLGDLENANLDLLFLAPIPGPTDYPFVRIGSRQPLEVRFADTEALLATLVLGEGQVGIALSTGRLKFSDADLAKADPDDVGFDRNYLGAQVFYDGVSLTQRPVPTRQPVQIVNSGGDPTVVDGKNHSIYLPDAAPLPTPGVSGVLHHPDGTGTIPNTTVPANIRPGNGSGLLRQIDGPWDLVLFADNGQIRSIRTFDDDDERPRFRFKIPRGVAYVDLRSGSGGSEIILGRQDLRRFDGKSMYFLQSGIQPSVFANEARMWARVRDEFVLEGNEVLVFSVDGAVSTWDAALDPGGVATSAGGTFSAEEIATSLGAVTGAEVGAAGGRVFIAATTVVNGRRYGDIEIGYGPGGTKDLSGPAALGFLPGWKVRIATPNEANPPPDLRWLPDNGSSVGVFRSPYNLDGSKNDIPDVRHVGTFDNVVLTPSISQSPVVLLDRPPLEDRAGYDEGIFFRIQDGLVSFNLENYEEVYYEFGLEKFSWAFKHTKNATVEQPTNNLFVGQGQVIKNSLRLPGNGLRLSTAGSPLKDQILDEDYILPDNGDPGIALLIDTVGALKQLGGRGTCSAGSTIFTDDSADIDFVVLGVKAGWQLKVTQGNAQGTYIVAVDATLPNELEVKQPFPVSDGPVPWELYDGVTTAEFDPGIVADTQYVQFQHLPQDPWQVRVLSPLGDVPADQAAQNSGRLMADLGDALQSGRVISVRYGLEPNSQTAELVALEQEELGEIVHSALEVPAPASERFVNEDFSIRVGDKTYTFTDGNLVKIAGALTFPLVGDVIEVQDVTGLLNFGTDVFVQFDGQSALYIEEFLTPNLSPISLPSGKVEYDPDDGKLNFNALDMANFGGTKVYLVEEMNTETSGQDVTLNPIQGSFAFTKPLREFQVVETHYFQAENGTGEKLKVPVDPENLDEGLQDVEVTEQLPLFVRLEAATPENNQASGTTSRWVFNPTKRTVDEDVEVALYVGSTLYNIGSSPTATFEIDNDSETYVAILAQPVDVGSEVLVSYAVFEAFGGEQTYTVSQPPVYRPPFRIETNRTSFALQTDRTDDTVPGKLLRVAEFPFYLTASIYDPASDLTIVDFIPETQLEAGSRDPGGDSLSLLSDVPLSTDISPDAHEGLWLDITARYEPVNKGFQSIKFLADLTSFLVAGHLLELGGLPFVISGVTLVDGSRTQIDITSFFPRGFAFGQDTVKVSVRPVYQPTPSQFIGRGGVATEEPFELILFGERDVPGNLLPGRTLRSSIDYELNFDDGAVEFLNPPQGSLLPTQSLYLRHTRQRATTPVEFGPFILNPRFVASFSYVASPSEENGRLGQILLGTYTFSNPDTFFYRTLPLLSYLGEVANEVAQGVAAQLPSLGPAPAVIPPVENANQGRLGLKSQRRDLEDQDRAARVFLEFYNEAIVAFEQITETLSGNIIGDRDGKFQFLVGKGKEVTPPGYEDQITGELNARNLFSEVFFGYNPKVTFLTRDFLVDPTDFTVVNDQLEGPFLDPDFLADLQALQRGFALNDVDDIVLYSRTRKRLRLFPLRLESLGKYRCLGEPSPFSRIFPELAEYFTLTDPGIGADLEAVPVNPGVYAFRKKIKRLSIKGSGGQFKTELPKRASTFFKGIADVGNPVLGQVENIGSVTVRNRLPRARIFAFSPTGFPEFDDIPFVGTDFGANPRPAVIATPLPLQDLPIGKKGLPDVFQFAAQGGEVIDLTTGDPDLFTPAWQVTDARVNRRPKITFGRPDGRILDVQTSESVSFDFPSSAVGIGDPETFTVGKSVFVGEVLLGCIITFAREDSNPVSLDLITSINDLLEVSEDSAVADGSIKLFRGDTIFVTPTDAEVNPGADPDEPSTKSDTEAQLEGLPNYRVGFDVGVDRPDGELRDITFPSFKDPSIFGIKELLGQKPPSPLSNVEGIVTFRNGFTEPAPIPALTGGFTNDSGDYSLPYLYAQNTEIDQLGIVAGAFNDLFADSLVPNAVYPDEIQGTDGEIEGTLSGNNLPAAINTDLDVWPVNTAGGYTPHSGFGDVRVFDVLFVETGQSGLGLPAGSQGILSVGYVEGDASGSVIEPPRFITPTAFADTMRYVMRTAMSFVNQPVLANPPGMLVREIAGPVTQFDITQISTGILVFNDGTPAGVVGGLNNLITLGSGNVVTINLWTAPDLGSPVPVVIDTIILDFGANTATSGTGASAITAASADDNILSISTVGSFVVIGFLPPPVLPEDGANPGDTIPLWFTIDVDTSAGASMTAFVQADRLTFSEGLDLRSILPRTEPAVAGVPVFTELSVTEIQSKTTTNNTVNAPASVNGGSPFTFLARSDVYPFIGTFDSAVTGGSGQGTVRVMGFEGAGNTPITTSSPITFSAIPSSRFGEDQAIVIAEGTGVAGVTTERNNRISSDGATLLSVTGQGFEAVVAGDVLVILGSDDVSPKGAVTAGTYLVKHTVEPNEASTQRRDLSLVQETLPSNTPGWADVQFPSLVLANVNGGGAVEISNTVLVDGTSAWDAAGGVIYFIAQPDPAAGDYMTANYKITYTAVNIATNTFNVNALSVEDFSGASASADVIDTLPAGTLVSGFYRFDITMENAADEKLPHNCVGAVDLVPTPIGGFNGVAVSGPGGAIAWDLAGGTLVAGVPGVDQLGVFVATSISNTAFDPNPDAYVYNDIAQFMQIDQTDPGNTDWDTIHAVAGLYALMPGDSLITITGGLLSGFHAQAGIFLEPSWPKPVLDLSGGAERVVDSSNSVAAADIGFRDPTSFGEVADEPVTWEVRRIRRFHDVLQGIGELLGPLRYVYQKRTGVVSAFGPAPVGPDAFVYPYVVTANDATNLGPFNDNLVNVNPGDFFRLLDDEGNLLDEIEIAGIESGTQIWLKEPGITKVDAADVPGLDFEIYLRQIPVPHEQSNEQLFTQIVDQVLLEREADYSTQDGGFVPSEVTPTDPRRLKDTDGDINFSALGVQEGDIVLIDSAGLVQGPTGVPATGQEQGTRPFGDRSVPNRTVATAGQDVPFIGGAPSELDDNRGWYRVTEVAGDAVTVSSQTEYSADPGAGNVTFGVDAEYTVYPTVSASTAPFADPPGGPGVEGQMDLRPTSFAGENGSASNSFLGNLLSIAPVSYTIFRPSALFSEDAVDLVLLMRERTLSFLEEFEVFFREDKYGSYFVFQRDEHISDLGNPLIPDEGKGVMSNELVDGVRGLVAISPFANTTDSLSVLDRRFWVLDTRLDSEFPVGSPPGTPSYSTLETNVNNPAAEEGDGRPVLIDRIADVLDNDDQFREQRFAWLDFRVNREDGTLEQIRRFDRELPKKRREELRQLRLSQSIGDAG
jgi:hypothetical protein